MICGFGNPKSQKAKSTVYFRQSILKNAENPNYLFIIVNVELTVQHIIQAFDGPLPGPDLHAQWLDGQPRIPKVNARQSAVLVLLYPYQNTLFLPLIKRPPYDGVHGGQMAFPGGKMEPDDESLTRTALREAQEEIGIKAYDIQVIGTLTPLYIPPSNFWVQPIVGYIPYRPDFFPDVREVDTVVEVAAPAFLDPAMKKVRTVHVGGRPLITPGYQVDTHWIWGATALMLAEFAEVLRRIPK